MRGLPVPGNGAAPGPELGAPTFRQRQGLPHHGLPQVRPGQGRPAEPAGAVRPVLGVPVRAVGWRRAVDCLHGRQGRGDAGRLPLAVDAHHVPRRAKV